MLLVIAASEQASAAAAAALQAAAVSFFTAPGSTATPCSRNTDAAVVFVPTSSTAIASRRLACAAALKWLCAAVRTLPKRSHDCRQSFTRRDTVCLTHLHRSGASLGFVLRLNCEQNPRATLRLHRRASSYTVGCASASCGTASPHRCAATFGIAAGTLRPVPILHSLHTAAPAAQTAARAPLRGRKRRTTSQRCHTIAAARTTAIDCIAARACVVGRDGGQQAPEAARDA